MWNSGVDFQQDSGWYRPKSAGGGGYTAQGVLFDGTNDYLTGSTGPLTGEANSQKGIVSFWFRMNGTDSTFQILYETDASTGKGLQIGRNNTNHWYINYADSAAGGIAAATSTATFVAAGATWHHFLVAVDLSGGAMQFYIDDAATGSPSFSGATTINYAAATGTRTVSNRATGNLLVNADIADLYINQSEYLDMTVTANRRKFISATGHPVDLGANGSTPTGTAPILYFSGAVGSWQTNKGTGGGFTLTGALTASSSNP